ncbi:uncharacterized protein LOC143218375 [Lasioglossum baleicum]|uniref:uncharacterized protein LOC143218375 n=1 Tax=Lasioglossum baleicum TaxID=434251 RepID=UPI003FCCC168
MLKIDCGWRKRTSSAHGQSRGTLVCVARVQSNRHPDSTVWNCQGQSRAWSEFGGQYGSRRRLLAARSNGWSTSRKSVEFMPPGLPEMRIDVTKSAVHRRHSI